MDDKSQKFTEKRTLTRRRFLQGAAATAAASALSTGPFFLRTVSAAAGDEWKLGTIFPLTGNLAFGGNEGMLGALVAQELVNERGGIDTLAGKKKIVFAKADAPDQTASVNEMNRLLGKEKVQLTLGSFSSAIAYTASAVAERRKTIFWETDAVVIDLTTRGFKYLFRTNASAAYSGGDSASFVANYVAGKLGKKPEEVTVGVIWEDGTYGSSVHQGILERNEKHKLNIVLDESYSGKSTDLSPVVLKVKAANPDVLMGAASGADAILVCKHMRELDVNPKVIIGTSAGWGVPNFGNNVGKAVDGIFTSDFPCEVNAKALSPHALELREEFIKRYVRMTDGKMGHGSANSWLTFAGVMVLFENVLSQCKSLDPDEVREAALKVDLAMGEMANANGCRFIPHDQKNGGQNERSFCCVVQWQDQTMFPVYPENLATREPIRIPLPSWNERA